MTHLGQSRKTCLRLHWHGVAAAGACKGTTIMMRVVKTPLPELPPRFHGSQIILSAYPKILQVERNESAILKFRDNARILGYLILEGPSDIASENVAHEVDSCPTGDENLSNLGQFYFDHFIRICKLLIQTSNPLFSLSERFLNSQVK